jgi:diaminopimelate epimerase
MRALKGHGTGNDFVLIPDLDATIDLSPEMVRALCDRHFGVGADGVLRVVRTAAIAEGADQIDSAEFFMDYRNADGSVAEMCGNGVRVFARYLMQAGLVDSPEFGVATRGGTRAVSMKDDLVTVAMGRPHWLDTAPVVSLSTSHAQFASRALEIPNPHVVVEVSSLGDLAALDLSVKPEVTPELPHGQNVEFVVRNGPRHIAMRVHERGVGETMSCGTGICAAVVATAGEAAGEGAWRVDVPGGTCWVSWEADGDVLLTGPATLVGEIELSDEWLAQI